eukprot:588719-Ditylum_brightwellii.AAC.1
MLFFGQPKNKYHVCDLDNLYMPAKFAKMALKINEEITSKSGQLADKGTVKAATFCGDDECDYLP